MVLARHPLLLCVRWCGLVAFVLVTGPSVVGLAVDSNKAVLVGSTSPGFGKEATRERGWIVGWSTIQGRVDSSSDTELTFDAGSRWSVKVPYAAITHLAYGREVSRRVRGLTLAFPWSGSSQFTDNPHYLLTVIYQDQTGTELAEVFDLGANLIRPTLDTLEHRTKNRIEFLSVDACLTLRSPKECRVGSPAELRGLRRVLVDARDNSEYRANIVAEIESAHLGLEVVALLDDAEIVLRFHGDRFFEGKTIDGGRGEVTIVRKPDSVVVLQFADRDTSVWGRAPSINFGREFVKAYKKANDN